jgi:hypothetical protein
MGVFNERPEGARRATMKASQHLIRAQKALEKMTTETKALSQILTDHLGEEVTIEHQPSDGWVALFDGDHNAPLSAKEIDGLLRLDAEIAMRCLRAKSC